MQVAEILSRIRERQEAIRSLGATSLFIYGSRARGEERQESDLDVYVDYDPARFDFVGLVELEAMLTKELGLTVDVGTHDALHPALRHKIEAEALQVF